jgi:hypothetical protein
MEGRHPDFLMLQGSRFVGVWHIVPPQYFNKKKPLKHIFMCLKGFFILNLFNVNIFARFLIEGILYK